MSVSNNFKEAINNHLNQLAKTDLLFAQTLSKPNKNIDDCLTYIVNEVKKTGCNGFADDEIFAMAVHYYDEDTIEIGKPINCKVVVNHSLPPDPKPIKTEALKPTKSEAPKPTPKPIAKAKKQPKNNVIHLFQPSLFD